MGRYKNPLICDTSNLENISNAQRYSKAAINVNDYKDALLEAEKDDFIYLNPPYHHTSSTANFTGYSNYGFGSVVEKSSLKYLDNCGRPVFAYHKSKHKKLASITQSKLICRNAGLRNWLKCVSHTSYII